MTGEAPLRAFLRRLTPPVLLLLALALSLRFGKYPVDMGDLAGVLVHRFFGGEALSDPVLATVIWNIRLPRLLAGLLVGCALAGAGACFQGLFRNPLVSPDILGVSAGAGAGAVLAILFGFPIVVVQGAAFAGGIGAVGLAWSVSSVMRRRDPALVLVLAGVALDKLLMAATSLMKLIADPYSQLPTITYWLMGGLNGVTWGDLSASLTPLLGGLAILLALRWRLNVLSLGEDEARALGLETRRLRGLLVAGATLMTASAVAVAGPVGWIGLVVPHVARSMVGPDFRRLLPASLMLGAGFVVLMDSLARVVGSTELPLGLYTAMVGAPFFLWLLATSRRGW